MESEEEIKTKFWETDIGDNKECNFKGIMGECEVEGVAGNSDEISL